MYFFFQNKSKINQILCQFSYRSRVKSSALEGLKVSQCLLASQARKCNLNPTHVCKYTLHMCADITLPFLTHSQYSHTHFMLLNISQCRLILNQTCKLSSWHSGLICLFVAIFRDKSLFEWMFGLVTGELGSERIDREIDRVIILTLYHRHSSETVCSQHVHFFMCSFCSLSIFHSYYIEGACMGKTHFFLFNWSLFYQAV